CRAAGQAGGPTRGPGAGPPRGEWGFPPLRKPRGGKAPPRHCRATRSVESRSSHRLRMRCELETLLHTVPLHDPCSEMTTAVAYETREEPRQTDAVTALGIEGRRRADDPARGGSGRPIVRRSAQDEAERVAGGGREREPPRRHLIDAA